MKKCALLLILVTGIVFSQHMIVRVYVPSWQSLKAISEKPLDIAAGRNGEWYDIVADAQTMDKIIASGLPYEVKIFSLEYEKEKVLGQYRSYDQVTQYLRNLAAAYPSICKMDSLPIRTYQGRWLYGVKISDEPNIEDPNEGGLLIDGLHHAREWPTIEIVLFFADSMCKAYGVVPQITNIINTTELYCFPIINADGYAYDYPGYLMWRKNREPFGGQIGCDCNRNYPASAGMIGGDWGAVDNGKATHSPGDETFVGAWPNSGDETRGLVAYAKARVINAYMSYHCYSEYLMWGWAFTTTDIPDGTLCAQKGNYMAGLVQRQGGGTYTPGQIPEILYYVSGGSIDWVYSWNHYVNGISNLSYTTEAGTTFYHPTGDLDNIVRQNFKALKYLANFTDSIVLLCEGVVPPPQIYPIDTVDQNFTIAWHAKNTYDNHPVRWELVELSNPSIKTDSLESGTNRWVLSGYTSSIAQYHSPTHSLFSGNANDINNTTQTLHPYLVQPGDSLSFWCRYTLEPDFDVTVAEVSENAKEWFLVDTLARFNGTQSTWVRRAYSLASWIGKSIYIRFRTMYDGSTISGGFYVDDIRPVCLFGNVTSISSNIMDTLYSFTAHPVGEYYFYVRGNNTAWGWGDFSCLEKVNVTIIGVSETTSPKSTSTATNLVLTPNPFHGKLVINYALEAKQSGSEVGLRIYNVSGRLVKSFDLPSAYSLVSSAVTWDGADDHGRQVPAGVYFVRLEAGGEKIKDKAILLR